MNPLPALLLSLFVVAAAADDSLTELKIDGPGCGQRNPPYTEPMISPYIINGEPAPPYVYPYIQVSLTTSPPPPLADNKVKVTLNINGSSSSEVVIVQFDSVACVYQLYTGIDKGHKDTTTVHVAQYSPTGLQCLLYHGTMQECGGALITNTTGDYWFITAGHCLDTGLDAIYTIRCGIYNTRGPSQPFEFNPKYLRPIVHENYNVNNKHNDIALFPLEQTGFPSERVGAVCITRQEKQEGERAIVLGWGNTRETRGMANSYSPYLKMGSEYVMLDSDCDKSYSGNYYEDAMMCAGNTLSGDDACQGDSGGPLVAERNGELQLIGITSFGFGCGRSDSPGVYADVMKLKSWINSKINAWAPEVVG